MMTMVYLSICCQDLCKRAAVLSNKIMKHGFVAEMEKILDAQEKVTHDELSKKVIHMYVSMHELLSSVDPDTDCIFTRHSMLLVSLRWRRYC